MVLQYSTSMDVTFDPNVTAPTCQFGFSPNLLLGAASITLLQTGQYWLFSDRTVNDTTKPAQVISSVLTSGVQTSTNW